MKIGIIPNITKERIDEIVVELIEKITKANFTYLISDLYLSFDGAGVKKIPAERFIKHEDIYKNCDIAVSIGGDGTVLKSVFDAREENTPIAGLNFGKLGFLAEYDVKNIDKFLLDLKTGNYNIAKRMTLEASCENHASKLFALNDIVIEKGRWPKLIEISIKVDDDYVCTFSGDGIIISTPTGSTGYSLSTGGPIVSPKTDVITLSPICPHTLTMRPLVVSASQTITITANTPFSSVQINCDGQRVELLEPPARIVISRSKNPARLVYTGSANYYEVLRNKLFWGIDVRKNNQ